MNMNQLMKQAQAMQKKIVEQQEELAKAEFVGKAGGEVVTVTINGNSEMLKLKIDDSIIVVDEKEVLEDLVIAAHNDARKKLEESTQGNMQNMLGGMGLPPGFKMPF